MGLGRPICALWYKERISITKEKYSANEQFMYPLMAHNNNNLIAHFTMLCFKGVMSYIYFSLMTALKIFCTKHYIFVFGLFQPLSNSYNLIGIFGLISCVFKTSIQTTSSHVNLMTAFFCNYHTGDGLLAGPT